MTRAYRPNRSIHSILILASFTIAAAVALRASDPVGAYTMVDRVVRHPNSTEPTSVQIFGVFSFAIPRERNGQQPTPPGSFVGTPDSGDVYGAVQKGYLFYTCPAGQERACRGEWNDLHSIAGTGAVVGFGTRWQMTGRVRPAPEPPASPDVYPLNVGIVKMGVHGGTSLVNRSQYPDLVAALQAASRGQ
jgi:hypothetical protein